MPSGLYDDNAAAEIRDLDSAYADLVAWIADAETISPDPADWDDAPADETRVGSYRVIRRQAVYFYGAEVAKARAIAHAEVRLAAAMDGDADIARRAQMVVDALRALLAIDPAQRARLIEVVRTFKRTLEAVSHFVNATSPEAAYAILRNDGDLLLTDLACDLIAGKMREIFESGDVARARGLQAGPLQLLFDAREHGVEGGVAVFIQRDAELARAKSRMAAILTSASAELNAAVDGLLSAPYPDGLPAAMLRAYDALIQPLAAAILAGALEICQATAQGELEAARLAHLHVAVERLAALAHGELVLSREEQVRAALAGPRLDD